MGTRVLCSSVASILLAATAASAVAKDTDGNSRVRIGFEIAPVQLDLRGKNRALVGLGSYLVNAAGGSVLAHLLDLEKRGLVVQSEQQWSKAA